MWYSFSMNFDAFPRESINKIPLPEIEVNPDFDDFLPDEFKANPMAYFEEKGINIKSGEVKHDEQGIVKEDPTAVKDLPTWHNESGQTVEPVAKRINTEKSQVKKTADPFYEYQIMELVKEFSLPAPQPIAKVEQGGVYLIVMQKVPGFRWVDKDVAHIKDQGYSEEDLENIKSEANKMMSVLSKKYEEVGILRTWKLKDMIFDIDLENKKVQSITPVDWERTKLDLDKVTEARVRLGKSN